MIGWLIGGGGMTEMQCTTLCYWTPAGDGTDEEVFTQRTGCSNSTISYHNIIVFHLEL